MPIMRIFLEAIKNPDFSDLFADDQSCMNEQQFKLAIKGLRIRDRSREVAYRILVKGDSRQSVIEDTGMQKAAISQLMSKIMKNFQEQLARNGLVYKEYVLPEKLEPVIDAVEEEHLRNYLKESKKSRRS